jgi:hypothetical protein
MQKRSKGSVISLSPFLLCMGTTTHRPDARETAGAHWLDSEREYPDSPYANQAKSRLAELEKAR